MSVTSCEGHVIRERQHRHDSYRIGVTPGGFACVEPTFTALLGKAYITSGAVAYTASSSGLPP